ncbi:SMI1/KNR4 family protein [Loigolactobacillus iwatensis]|uniref:SMI1/KNR4 family protein n=1 Tax=Loigolactobacillus iwatensis TaxID=1267156 RepID=UPI000F7EC836|nr:SMI1/KNR4 family protein [Loigolactobacillus iwatensis]
MAKRPNRQKLLKNKLKHLQQVSEHKQQAKAKAQVEEQQQAMAKNLALLSDEDESSQPVDSHNTTNTSLATDRVNSKVPIADTKTPTQVTQESGKEVSESVKTAPKVIKEEQKVTTSIADAKPTATATLLKTAGQAADLVTSPKVASSANPKTSNLVAERAVNKPANQVPNTKSESAAVTVPNKTSAKIMDKRKNKKGISWEIIAQQIQQRLTQGKITQLPQSPVTAALLMDLNQNLPHSLPQSYQQFLTKFGAIDAFGYFFAGKSANPAADLAYLNKAVANSLLPEVTAPRLLVFAASEQGFLAYDYREEIAGEPIIVAGSGPELRQVAIDFNDLLTQMLGK